MIIRTAQQADRAGIRAVHEAAFGRTLEADIEQALYEAGDDRISMVAVEDDVVIGHVVLSAGSVGDALVLCLGPIGVDPKRQRTGVGTGLMHASLAAAAETEAGVVVLLGHTTYYPRFGFEPADPLGLKNPRTDGPGWMAFRLPGYQAAMRGPVRFPPAFDADTGPAS